VGLGLIGGSIALDLKKKKLARRVVGFSRRLATLKKAKRRGIVDEYFTDFAEGLPGLDFLVLAPPARTMEGYLRVMRRVRPDILATDAVSVKDDIVRSAGKILGPAGNFVGAHPIAGSEKSGLDAARENLFAGRTVLITPAPGARRETVRKVHAFWRDLGAGTIVIKPGEHDRLLALTSHLPHLVAFALADQLRDERKNAKLTHCVGSGFRDTTRIAKSSPELWADLFCANRKHLLTRLRRFEDTLQRLRKHIEGGASAQLERELAEMKKSRERHDER